ncbi:lamin tail domain-containing protein [Bacillus alveayuensis]|uniref:lamin tail domain-containing protein n=1 Tax=Aeribacillus alveayuensis TaxID=279215 RepID=UPI0006989AC5|nr:lamin tail domain-containing protein [Bacillus alveayuensis]
MFQKKFRSFLSKIIIASILFLSFVPPQIVPYANSSELVEENFSEEQAMEGNSSQNDNINSQSPMDLQEANNQIENSQSLPQETNRDDSAQNESESVHSITDESTPLESTPKETIQDETKQDSQTDSTNHDLNNKVLELNESQAFKSIDLIHEQVAVMQDDEPFSFTVEAKNATEVVLFYRTGLFMETKSIQMKKTDNDIFTAEIPNEWLWSPHFEYWIEAKNDSEKKNLPEDPSKPFIVEVQKEEPYDANHVPPLLITEVVPDTKNVGSKDGYEFIELYNNTDQALNLKGYSLHYQYPGTTKEDIVLEIQKDVIIDSQKSVVFWIKNNENESLTIDDFNKHFGVNIASDRVFMIPFDGLSNSGERAISIYSPSEKLIVTAAYNTYGADDTSPDKGIIYQYPVNNTFMNKVGLSEKATPGEIIRGQVPSIPVEQGINEDPQVQDEIIITHTPLTKIENLDDSMIQADIKNATSAKIVYKSAEKMEQKEIPLSNIEENIYSGNLPFEELWSPFAYYRIEAESQNGQVKTYPENEEWIKVEVNHQNEVDVQKVPPILITEIVPDTKNVNGKDGYEFIEIYNNTNRPINMKDYKILYRYPEKDQKSDLEWDIQDDKIVQPQDSFVIWIHNSGNNHLTIQQFNDHYGTDLEENEFTIIHSDGMANGSERTIIIAEDFGQEIAQATYNDNGLETASDQGIVYQYQAETKSMKKVGRGELATPAEMILGQVPDEPVVINIDDQAPVIEHTAPEKASGKQDLTLMVKVKDNMDVKGVILNYKLNASEEYKTVNMEKNENDQEQYTVTIPSSELWSNQFIYYVEASDGVNVAKTIEYVVELEQEKVDFQKIPELLITEIVPDSTNVNGLDGYEFIEVYNNTNQPINFKDYKIRYRYPMEGPEADLIWGQADDQDLIIPSGGTMVFWIINSGNHELTVQDFNNHYGTNLIENQSIVKIYNNGMANSSTRSLLVATNTGKEIAIAYYNDEVNVDDTIANKGILYKYPTNGSMELEKISSGIEDATPGTVFPAQVPKIKIELTKDSINPVIDNLTNEKNVQSSDNILIKADIQDDRLVKTAELYYRTDHSQNFKKINLEEDYNSRLYEHIIYSPEIIGRKFVEYYFKASDGTNIVTSETYTITIENVFDKKGLRLNVEDGQILFGEKVLKATSDTTPDQLKLFIDGKETTETFTSLETEAYFAFDVRKTNLYFQNGVTMGEEILRIFDDTINDYTTITVPIPADKLESNKGTTISIRSGTKVSPFDETSEENRDDFYVKNVRLVLSDGTVIYDPSFADANKELSIGDGAGSLPAIQFSFTIPEEKFASLAYKWDTTTVEEGKHVIAARDENGNEEKVEVIVDNSAPEINTTVEEGKEYKGTFTIDAKATDRFSKVEEVAVKLDDMYIDIPYETSSALLTPGEHQLVVTAKDAAGNLQTKKVIFKVGEEHPYLPDWLKPNINDTSTTLSVKVTDPTNDQLNVSFYQAFKYTADDKKNVKITKNISETEPPTAYEPVGEEEFSDVERKNIVNSNGETVATTTTNGFPYHRFDVIVDEKVDEDDEVELVWKGSSLEGRKVTMYAWSHTDGKWKEVDSFIAGSESFTLKGNVHASEYVKDHKVSVIVQDQIAETAIDYDYTFVWMSDTQYYSESYPYIYEKQVQWIADNKDQLKIQYVFHTGDLVDDADDEVQWDVADRSMKVLDDAQIPYGVLAGNHDVGHKDGSYDNYYKYFGDHRFAGRSYVGGSYKNNHGHYDLISVNGNDFIMMYMGWGVTNEDLQWMNEVLAKYPNHKAILAFHEYLLVSGNRSPVGNLIFEEVVKKHPNVIAVLSGHYHDSEKLIDEIDDNGDGTPDRKVYQMLADYQGGPEGGQGYLRLLHFNQETNEIFVKTYSPYLNDYNYYDPETYPEKDEFTIQFDLTPKEKKVETDYFEVNVYTNHLIGKVENVPSGETASVTWNGLTPNQMYYWYAVVEDQYGGKQRSDVWSFMTNEKVIEHNRDETNGSDQSESGENSEQSQQETDQNEVISIPNEDLDHQHENDKQRVRKQTSSTGIENVTDHGDMTRIGNDLPETATMFYRWMVLGLILLFIGVISLRFTRQNRLYK